jgi:hypothetical protein
MPLLSNNLVYQKRLSCESKSVNQKEEKPMAEEEIPRQLGAILDVLGLEWDSLFDGADKKEAGRNRDRVVGWLYRILDTLDNKTGHLLRFAALLLTAQTLVAGILVRNLHTPRWISILALFLLAVPLGPATIGLRVFTVKWKFFGTVRRTPEAVRDEGLIKKEIHDLAKTCDRRTDYHRGTLVLCYLLVISMFLTLILAIIVPFRYGLSST